MKDMNFFSIYSDRSSVQFKRQRLIKIGIGLLALVILVYGGLFLWKIAMDKEAQQIREYLASPEVQESLAQYNLEAGKLKALQDYNLAADNLIGAVDKLHNLTVEDMGLLASSIPATASIESMGYNKGEFIFRINAPSLAVSAQTQVRLEESGLFHHVVLSDVSLKEGGGYMASFTATKKVGDEE